MSFSFKNTRFYNSLTESDERKLLSEKINSNLQDTFSKTFSVVNHFDYLQPLTKELGKFFKRENLLTEDELFK